jgi:hypothetical protein
MKIKLTFTEEHIALIKALNFEKIDVNDIIKSFEQYNEKVIYVKNNNKVEATLGDILNEYRINIDSIYGVDNFNLWGGTYIWEQMAYILGIQDHVIKGTEEDPTGPKYPDEDMEHMKELDMFILTHLEHIFQLLLQFCTEGIQPGVTYWCFDYEKIWHKEKDS